MYIKPASSRALSDLDGSKVEIKIEDRVEVSTVWG